MRCRCHGRGHSKIFIMNIIYVEYLADMAQWQSKNKSTLHREQHTFFVVQAHTQYKRTHISGIIPTKITRHIIINAVKTACNAGSAAFEGSFRRHRVVTNTSQHVVVSDVWFFRCF